jgi:C1A family cysteine protease
MPIRIKKDRNTKSNNNRPNRPTNNTGGAGGLIAFAPLLFSLFKKKPKLVLIIAAIGALLYFSGALDGFLGEGGDSNPVVVAPEYNNSAFSTGSEYDEEKYVNTEIFASLADNKKNPMPNSISLLEFAPNRLNQGSQGSCVGWASSYAARTILEARATGKKPNSVAMSPSFLYNQIALKGCQGTYISEAMKSLQGTGDLLFSQFKYNERSCDKKPTQSEKTSASTYKIKGYNRLTYNGDKHRTDVLAIKQNLAQGAPVVIGMMVGGSFMQGMQGREVWKPTKSDYNQRGFGGHAMCVIGYDDYKAGGAFQIMNSWGPGWGKKGVAWVSYEDFDHFTKEAYGLYPMGNAKDAQFDPNKLNMRFGLVNNATKRNIPFQFVNGITFKTKQPISVGTEFKIESTNSIECYTYVFGQETDGSSYTLFPYTAKHSPYCGITGTRLFPNDHSLVADDKGNKDFMAIIVSKQPLDYEQLNRMINKSAGSTYQEKVTRVIQRELIPNVQFNSAGETINASCNTQGKNIMAVVLEIDKR